MDEKSPTACPGCEHELVNHVRDLGCVHAWEYDKDGLSAVQGCDCQLSHADISMTEHQWRYR